MYNRIGVHLNMFYVRFCQACDETFMPCRYSSYIYSYIWMSFRKKRTLSTASSTVMTPHVSGTLLHGYTESSMSLCAECDLAKLSFHESITNIITETRYLRLENVFFQIDWDFFVDAHENIYQKITFMLYIHQLRSECVANKSKIEERRSELHLFI